MKTTRTRTMTRCSLTIAGTVLFCVPTLTAQETPQAPEPNAGQPNAGPPDGDEINLRPGDLPKGVTGGNPMTKGEMEAPGTLLIGTVGKVDGTLFEVNYGAHTVIARRHNIDEESDDAGLVQGQKVLVYLDGKDKAKETDLSAPVYKAMMIYVHDTGMSYPPVSNKVEGETTSKKTAAGRAVLSGRILSLNNDAIVVDTGFQSITAKVGNAAMPVVRESADALKIGDPLRITGLIDETLFSETMLVATHVARVEGMNQEKTEKKEAEKKESKPSDPGK